MALQITFKHHHRYYNDTISLTLHHMSFPQEPSLSFRFHLKNKNRHELYTRKVIWKYFVLLKIDDVSDYET